MSWNTATVTRSMLWCSSEVHRYLGLDCSRMSDEQHKLLKRAKRDFLTTDEVFEAIQNEGVILHCHMRGQDDTTAFEGCQSVFQFKAGLPAQSKVYDIRKPCRYR